MEAGQTEWIPFFENLQQKGATAPQKGLSQGWSRAIHLSKLTKAEGENAGVAQDADAGLCQGDGA